MWVEPRSEEEECVEENGGEVSSGRIVRTSVWIWIILLLFGGVFVVVVVFNLFFNFHI